MLTISPRKLFNFIFCRTFKNFHFWFDFSFFALMKYTVLYLNIWMSSFNFIYKVFQEIVTKWFYCCEFWQSRWWNSTQNVIYYSSIGDAHCPNYLKYHQLKIRFCFSHYSLHRWHWSYYNTSSSPSNASSLTFIMLSRCRLMPLHCS